ncbi:MAG: hypothetical protein ACJ8AO_12375 [Gemmatimonadaceae bacterium]
MCTVLLVGSNTALLEGLAQTLASAGHRTLLTPGLPGAAEAARGERPLLVVVERHLAASESAELARIPLAPGGRVVVYRDEEEERRSLSLPTAVQRVTLADLALPLERHRLIALVERVEGRATAAGRDRSDTPPRVPRLR